MWNVVTPAGALRTMRSSFPCCIPGWRCTGCTRPLKFSSKRNTSPEFELASRWKLLWCWPGFGLALLLYLHGIRLFDPKINIYFELLRGRGCVESKNMTSAKRKSTMSSLNPSIIQVGSFKCRAGVTLWKGMLDFLRSGWNRPFVFML